MNIKHFLAAVALMATLTAQADDDTRIGISEIEATSNTSEIPVYGAQIVQPTVTVTKGQPAYFNIDQGNGWWHKKMGDKWVDVRSGTFTSGTWVFQCQVRIDGDAGYTHKFVPPVSTTVDGISWGVDTNPSVYSKYCWTWVQSPEYVIPEPVELYFHYWKDFDIGINYVGRPITSYSVAENAEGGTKPYTFSKASGPEWIEVSAEGIVSGTPTAVGDNDQLVVRVTDAAGASKEITIPVAKTYKNPDERTDVTEIVATSNISEIPVLGAKIVQPTVTVTQGQPAHFSINNANGWWYKWGGNDWVDVRSGTFTAGTWVFQCQVRIDGDAGYTHKFGSPVSTTVDGVSWGIDQNPSVFDTFSYTWVQSPEFVIAEDAGIHAADNQPAANSSRSYNLNGQCVNSGYKGIVIRQGRKTWNVGR